MKRHRPSRAWRQVTFSGALVAVTTKLRRRPPPIRNRALLRQYEEDIILRDLDTYPTGAKVTAKELGMKFPDRYSDTLLPKALARMWNAGYLRRSRISWRRSLFGSGYVYSITGVGRERMGRSKLAT